ncbi:MAG: PIN domain-containing protein [Undibacterium sp.]|nr:PIN domain-containing protein [Opitutaceae bacterium]
MKLWVIDTNVLVSAALTRGGVCDRLMRAAQEGRFGLAWNAAMLREYRDVLLRPKFGLNVRVVTEVLAIFRLDGYREGEAGVTLPDPDDAPFLAVALMADRVLVTGNTRHFPEKSRGEVEVLTPAEALVRLGV